MGWLGLDDTDHLGGGCTTWTMHQMLVSLPVEVRQVGDPCLVRLYPMASARTRGNAALAVELDVGLPPSTWHAWLTAYWKEHLAPLVGQVTVSTHAEREQVPSDPGLVWFDEKPPPEFYRKAVKEEVSASDAPPPTWSAGGRGIIGATAAVCWTQRVTTWEGIAWRQGSTGDRQLDAHVLERLDHDPRLVACRDPRKGRGLLAPRGHSPVLFGLRGTDRAAVERGVRSLTDAEGTEAVAASRVFQTNQGSGDHLEEPVEAVVERVSVLRGGHVALTTSHGTWLAFAPSVHVCRFAAQLVPGDTVRGLGLHSTAPGREGLHLEALEHLDGPMRNRQRPMCPACGVRLKSAGKEQGLRCPSCSHREPDRWEGTPVVRSGWVQPPLDRRRHLAPDLRAV
ncbi:MAG: TiaS agmantine-binding domain-containing protein [Candidatus Poseidoniaceae archaeon]